MSEKSRLMPISYYNPKQAIRLSAYADTIVLEPDGREQHLRAIRFGGYPEMVRAMSDAIYAGATLETEFADETAMLTCEPKKYECHLATTEFMPRQRSFRWTMQMRPDQPTRKKWAGRRM